MSRKLGKAFPTAAEESADPDAADQLYARGARWLLDETRDKERFPLLFKELIANGFRRNALGIKPIAIFIALASAGWIFAAADILTMTGFNTAAVAEVKLCVRVVFGVDVMLLATWVFFITERTVRSSALMYADLLLRACDRL